MALGKVESRLGTLALAVIVLGCAADEPTTPGSMMPATTGEALDAVNASDGTTTSGSGTSGDAGSSDPSSVGPSTGAPGEDSTPAESGDVPLDLPPEDTSLTSDAEVLITVVTPTWDDPEGVLVKWRRSGAGWDADGAEVPIVLGRTGLAWGRGLHGDGMLVGLEGPEKYEGDGKSPAGAFWLDTVLGYAAVPPPGTVAEYQAMTPTVQCIEDVDSSFYNRIADPALVKPDWSSTDRLYRDDGLYEFIVFVNQNTDPAPVAGRGSCILLHVTTSSNAPTSGCTAMDRGELEVLVQSLSADHNMLVQLPAHAYDALEEEWGLPPR